jgi:hypothetical protein
MGKLALAAIEEMESPRDILRRAIEAKKAVDAKAEQARCAVARARLMASNAESDAANYQDIANELAAYTAGQIATSVLTANEPDLEISPELKARQVEAEKANQKVSDAKAKLATVLAAEGVLADGLTAAEREAKMAAEAVNRAAIAVIAEEAEAYLKKAIKAQAKLWVMDDILAGFASIYERKMPQEFQSRRARFKRGDREAVARIENLAHGDYAQWKQHLAGVHRRMGQVWEGYLNRLENDADATLPELQK